MTYQFTYTDKFKKHFKNLSDNEKKQVKGKLKLFSDNPLHPSLRAKKVQGTEYLECSVNMDIRIIWYYEGDVMIVLVDIGHHDILNKF